MGPSVDRLSRRVIGSRLFAVPGETVRARGDVTEDRIR
jgi:hypothetical protein